MKLPEQLREIVSTIHHKGFDVFVVGGAVRDFLLGNSPQDWDLATNAKVNELKKMFEKVVTVGERHGTIAIIKDGFECEVTEFRGENIEEDLGHRDFTINAIALSPITQKIYDPFLGKRDLDQKTVRFVKEPKSRIMEDPLRLIRAVRFACQLGFKIEPKSMEAVSKFAHKLKEPSVERIRDEFSKILLSPGVEKGIDTLRETGLLKHILPELLQCINLPQRGAHIYDVYWHNIKACCYTPPDLILRLAGLLHDIGKPVVKGRGSANSYPGHEEAGANLAHKILKRLRYPNNIIKQVVSLIRNHLFVSRDDTPDYIVRRLLAELGKDGTQRLLVLMEADRKAITPEFPLENVKETKKHFIKILKRDGIITIKDLAVTGNDIIQILDLEPGPAVGMILNKLWEMVLKEPELNTREKLIQILKQN